MIRILDPTIRLASAAAAPQPAPRPERLAGVTVGLLANGKSNGMMLLDRIAELLRERRGIAEVVRLSKTNASVPVTEEQAEPLLKQCAVMITAIGD
jgi:predicted lipid-binding transport protein (Tim44 family)